MMEYYIKVLQNYAKFEGRARRSEYWYFVLFNTVISLVLGVIDEFLGIGFLGSLYSLAILVPSLAVTARRMHDVNKSAWFMIIPIYNLILTIQAGDVGSNDYGPDPKMDYQDEIDQIGR